MKRTFTTYAPLAILALAALVLSAWPKLVGAQTAPTTAKMSADQAREENAYAIGVQASLWGYPLRFYGGMVPPALKVGGAYVNDLRKFTELKTAKDRFIVTPNNVTIDAYCTFDVTSEPLVIFVPKLAAPRW